MVQIHRTLGVIPARYASTRFPGKPLELIDGRPLILHVLDQVKKSKQLFQVMVATDHPQIEECVRSAGSLVFQTPSDLPSGTDRVRHAVQQFSKNSKEDIHSVVNIQGDEPLVEPALIDELAMALQKNLSFEMVTACRPLASSLLQDKNVVKVILNQRDEAIYFSRFPIPYSRENADSKSPLACYQHLGIYGFQKASLAAFCDAKPGSLEKAESLEQLRALELGMKIKVIHTTHEVFGVDVPEDIAKIEKILKQNEK